MVISIRVWLTVIVFGKAVSVDVVTACDTGERKAVPGIQGLAGHTAHLLEVRQCARGSPLVPP
jgi:hypothetical protein